MIQGVPYSSINFIEGRMLTSMPLFRTNNHVRISPVVDRVLNMYEFSLLRLL